MLTGGWENDNVQTAMIGAACSTACGYISNFISRVLEHIDDDIHITEDGETEIVRVPLDKIYLHIILLEEIDAATE